MVELFDGRYMRRLNADDVQHLIRMHAERNDFPGMWVALIACTGNGKIVKLLGKTSLQEAMSHQQSCLKRLFLKTCGYEIHALVSPVHMMISTCCVNLSHIQ